MSAGNEILFTIGIPTYNRAHYLKLCLEQIFKQIQSYESLIEVIVSDNCSPDNTEEVINDFRSRGYSFKYMRNEENIGADRNFAQCFDMAAGKYVIIFGDDDVFLDGAIDKIMAVLTTGNYGLVYVNSYGFETDYRQEMPEKQPTGTRIYTDQAAFIRKIHYWITFSSGQIVNKTLLPKDFDPTSFYGTYFVQLSWVIAAFLAGEENAVIEDLGIAYKSGNTGGYPLAQVFGVYLNRIFDGFIAKGASPKVFDIVNRELVKTFFPNMFLTLRRESGHGFYFKGEDHFRTLYGVFRKYPMFWLVTVPSLKLPYPLAAKWTKGLFKLFALQDRWSDKN